MRASIRALACSAYGPRQIAAWSSLPALYHAWAMSAGGETVFVAESGGRILGYAGLREGEVTALFVLPSAAGRGLGSRLLGRVERQARRRGLRRLAVRASRNGAPFYRARGYAGSRSIRVPLPGGGALPAVLLARRIDRA
ncbi:MAG TPA: GNAT family N-acetyltransferase [Anaeromyxobacteraceae bacterium]|nr:GNAT family N-acetyltransferase [Anaeromyxobacteraceae bacterium]